MYRPNSLILLNQLVLYFYIYYLGNCDRKKSYNAHRIVLCRVKIVWVMIIRMWLNQCFPNKMVRSPVFENHWTTFTCCEEAAVKWTWWVGKPSSSSFASDNPELECGGSMSTSICKKKQGVSCKIHKHFTSRNLSCVNSNPSLYPFSSINLLQKLSLHFINGIWGLRFCNFKWIRDNEDTPLKSCHVLSSEGLYALIS